jgi:hypothetical protein
MLQVRANAGHGVAVGGQRNSEEDQKFPQLFGLRREGQLPVAAEPEADALIRSAPLLQAVMLGRVVSLLSFFSLHVSCAPGVRVFVESESGCVRVGWAGHFLWRSWFCPSFLPRRLRRPF